MKKIILKPKKDAPVRRYHPWVFSGAIAEMDGEPQDGELVEVYSRSGDYLATGHYQDSSIRVRLISFEPTVGEEAFWSEKINRAYRFRQSLGLALGLDTNCYRLVHAEGDGLPGLIIDLYDDTAVIQCHSIGMHLQRMAISRALVEALDGRLKAIYDKSKETLPNQYAEGIENGYLFGEVGTQLVKEHGISFLVDWEKGQKTGFFLDQRDNRKLLATYASGKQVLNTFCYSGGFSLYALQAGATQVHSVDSSSKAIELTRQNVALNGFSEERHRAFSQDVMDFFQESEDTYDLVVVDPPAFAKNINKRHNAVQGYKRLNAKALNKLRSGGILFTFSCSQVVDPALFYNTIVAAALEARRQVKVMHKMSQPPDHPVSLFHPEGAYLKGLVLYVE